MRKLMIMLACASALSLLAGAANAQPPDGRGQGRDKAKDETAQQADKAKDKADADGRGDAEGGAQGRGKGKNKDGAGDPADDAAVDNGRGPNAEKGRGKPQDDVEAGGAAGAKDKVNWGLGERADGEPGARDPWTDRDADCAAVQNAQGDDNALAGGKPENAGPKNDRDSTAGADDDDDAEAEDAEAAEEAKPEKKRGWRWPWQRRDDD